MLYRKEKVLLTWIYVIHIYYSVGQNQIGNEGAITIGNALKTNQTLTILNLCNKYNKPSRL
jgi:hypothetical protein